MLPSPRRRARAPLALTAFAALAALPALALAEQVTAVTAEGNLVTFDTATPGTIATTRAITGVAGTIVGIDLRPRDGTLYAITAEGNLYRIDPGTGLARQVGTTAVTAPIGTAVGVDFNPVADRLRVVNAADRNFRVNPADGSVTEDATLAYAPADPGAGADPAVVALAYNNNTSGAVATTAYAIDAARDVLVTVNPPNAGVLNTIGALGVNAGNDVAFDVSGGSGNAFAAIALDGTSSSGLYSVNLATGAVTLVGPVGTGTTLVRAMTLGTPNAPLLAPNRELIALSVGNELVRFNASSPGTVASRTTVSGLAPGDSIVGIDVRPADGRLYGVGLQGRLYRIDAATGAATQVGTGTFDVPLVGAEFGVDFDPATDDLRVVSDAEQNLRIDPATGEVLDANSGAAGTQTDTPLAYVLTDSGAGANPNVTGAAYDRNDAETQATLFAIDSDRDQLVRVGDAGGAPNSENGGELRTIGALGVDTTALVGFEVAGDATALAALQPQGSGSQLYTVDTATGAASLVGTIGVNENLRGLTVAPTAPTVPCNFSIKLLLIRLDFCPPGGRDSVQATGKITVPSGSNEGRTVTVNVGGFVETFTLDARGRAKNTDDTASGSDDDTFQLVGRPRNGVQGFVLNLRRENLRDALADEGFIPGEARKVSKNVVVSITIEDGSTCTTTKTVRYTSGNGHDGIALKRN